MTPPARNFLRTLFDAAVSAADPRHVIGRHLPTASDGRTVVVGAGKASAQMAAALEDVWPTPLSGLVVTRYGHACPTSTITVVEAGHPVPDAAGVAAAERMLGLVSACAPDELVIALMSGGGSELLPAPPVDVSLADEIALQQALLASGAPISAMNLVRKHVSRIKGGRLALATRARVATLIISDVPGDNLALVASGPTLPDHSTRSDALEMIARYAIDVPPAIRQHLSTVAADAPHPDDPRFLRNTHAIIASATLSLAAAAQTAEDRDVDAIILSDAVEGEARDVARSHASVAQDYARRIDRPVVLLAGGETTVTLRNRNGRGGRNTALALAFADAIDGVTGITLLAADTDGIDGSGDNAGALVDGTTAPAVREAGLDPRALLDSDRSYDALSAVDALLSTGPTGTNVNDFHAILVEPVKA